MFRGRRSKGLWDLTRLCGRCSKSSSVKCHDSDWKNLVSTNPRTPRRLDALKVCSLALAPVLKMVESRSEAGAEKI